MLDRYGGISRDLHHSPPAFAVSGIMKTILITNDPAIAADAQEAGVSRIMLDLESHGKKERQASRNTFISSHGIADIAPLRDVLTTSELIVRINPIHADSRTEIAQSLAAGANCIMLPMITSMEQIDEALELIAGKARLIPLVETAYSMAHIADIAANPTIEEVYLGLNDLHLQLGLDFLFEPLALGIIDWMAEKVKTTGKPFGFGGIARMGSGELPAQAILGEHVRLGSAQVILSSRFCKDVEIDKAEGRLERLSEALADMAAHEKSLGARTPALVEADRRKTAQAITTLARTLRRARLAA